MTQGIGLACAALLFTSATAMADAPKAAPPTTPKETPADTARRAQPVVTYSGGQVTVGELEDAVAAQSQFMRIRYKDPVNLKELLEKTLRFDLIADEAARRAFDKNAAVSDAVKQSAVQQLMKNDFDDPLSASSISADEIAAYYQAHIDEYLQPAMQRASHVLLATEAEAKAFLAQSTTMDLRAFREAARDKSLDEASKLRGGDLRYFDAQGKARGEPDAVVPPAIVKAAFLLKEIGATAPAPIKVPGGYSIVKLTGERPAISRKLEGAAETIRIRLWRERRQAAIETFVATLRNQIKPELHPELADAIKIEEPSPVSGPGIPHGFPTSKPPAPNAPTPPPH